MSIAKTSLKIKSILLFLAKRDILLASVLVAASLSSYWIGVHQGANSQNSNQVIFIDAPQVAATSMSLIENSHNKTNTTESSPSAHNQKTTIFASKSGSKYYFPWCKSGNRVKLENRIYYQSAQAAEAAGKTLAANCTP
jgi:hypothetical protein